jgi:hypothetical protein
MNLRLILIFNYILLAESIILFEGSLNFNYTNTLFLNFPLENFTIVQLTMIFSSLPLASAVFAVWNILNTNRISRFGGAIFFIISVFTSYEFIGRTYHNLHGLIYASIFLLFLKKRDLLEVNNRSLKILRLIQASILSTYFCAGLAKMQNLILNKVYSIDLLALPLDYIVYAQVQASWKSKMIPELLKYTEFKYIAAICYFFVLLFELTSFLPVLIPKYMKIFGFFIIFFHLLNTVAMGISFVPAPFVALLFLVTAEQSLDSEPLNKNKLR